MKLKLIDEELSKLWSIRVAIIWGVFCGFYMFLPALADSLSKGQFAALCIIASVVMIVARATKQPGLHE